MKKIKYKKGYICMVPLKTTKDSLPIFLPKEIKGILGLFTSKKEALKYGKEILEVDIPELEKNGIYNK